MHGFISHTFIKHFFAAALFGALLFFPLIFLMNRAVNADTCPADNPNCNSPECSSSPCTPPGNPPPASLEGCTTQTIPGIGTFTTCPQPETSGGYLQKMYAFLLAFVAIAAFGGITYGGLLYVFSAGNISSTDEAKKWIWNALIGLLITAISFILLRTINPDLITNFNLDLSKYQKGAQQQQTIQGTPPGAGAACGATLPACPGGYQCVFDPAENGTCQVPPT